MVKVTEANIEHAIALVDEHACSPEEIAIILDLPIETVLLRLIRPCICGVEQCYVVRRSGEKSSHFRARKSSGSDGCKSVARGKRYGIRPSGRPQITEAVRQQIYALTAAGVSFPRVASQLNVSERSVCTYAAPAEDRDKPLVQIAVAPKLAAGDPLLAALQRRHPPHEDASVFALAHEYPPMRRGVRRLEAVG